MKGKVTVKGDMAMDKEQHPNGEENPIEPIYPEQSDEGCEDTLLKLINEPDTDEE